MMQLDVRQRTFASAASGLSVFPTFCCEGAEHPLLQTGIGPEPGRCDIAGPRPGRMTVAVDGAGPFVMQVTPLIPVAEFVADQIGDVFNHLRLRKRPQGEPGRFW